ncbi:MAG: hypothetical protein IJZ20_08820 [Clostridia bacterium]|nr:hypothetical protein [Clostridia bacterium]MBQ8759778.1 hypothetical protein [Clostridia bacterium]
MGIWFEIAVIAVLVVDVWQKRMILHALETNRSRDKPEEKKKAARGIGANMTDEAWRDDWRGKGDEE